MKNTYFVITTTLKNLIKKKNNKQVKTWMRLKKSYTGQELMILGLVLILFISFIFYEIVNLSAHNAIVEDYKKDVFFKKQYQSYENDIKDTIYTHFRENNEWIIQYVNSEDDISEEMLWCNKKVIAIVNWKGRNPWEPLDTKADYYIDQDKKDFTANDIQVTTENPVYLFHCYYWFKPTAAIATKIW